MTPFKTHLQIYIVGIGLAEPWLGISGCILPYKVSEDLRYTYFVSPQWALKPINQILKSIIK